MQSDYKTTTKTANEAPAAAIDPAVSSNIKKMTGEATTMAAAAASTRAHSTFNKPSKLISSEDADVGKSNPEPLAVNNSTSIAKPVERQNEAIAITSSKSTSKK